MAELVEAHRYSEKRLARAEARLARLEEQMEMVIDQVAVLTIAVGDIQGTLLEEQYRRNASAYFGRIIRKVRVLSSQQLADLLDQAYDRGEIAWNEREEVLLCDVVMRGRSRDDNTPLYVMAEVSLGIGQEDVDRAVRRAQILQRVVEIPVIPAVAGRRIDPLIDEYARDKGVWRVVNGHVVPPDQPTDRST
ncbi:MAG: hypothetical protein Q9O62_14110 [Ardenticatenia bacterium]|nr:hypothetical protein [Ardenticatenia bacterium]